MSYIQSYLSSIPPISTAKAVGTADTMSVKTGQSDAAPEVTSAQELDEGVPSAAQSEIAQALTLSTKESRVLPEMGQEILAMTPSHEKQAVVKKEDLSEKLNMPVKVVAPATKYGGKAADRQAEQETHSKLNEELLGKASVALESVSGFSEVGLSSLKIIENQGKLDAAKTEFASKQKEIDNLKQALGQAKKDGKAAEELAKLEKEIQTLTVEVEAINVLISGLEKEHEKLTSELTANVVSAGLRVSKETFDQVHKLQETGKGAEVVQASAEATGHVAQALPLAFGVTGSVLSVVTVAIRSKELNDNREIAKKILAEESYILMELDTCRDDPVMTKILELRLQNLAYQYNENAVKTFTNALLLASGVLGSVASAKTVAIAVGATVGVTLGAATAATGIGAMAFGAGALVVSVGYLAHKNRHAIVHKLESANLSRKEFFVKRDLEHFKAKKEEIQKKYEETTSDNWQEKIKNLQATIEECRQYIQKELRGRTMGPARAAVRSQIADMEDQIKKIKKSQQQMAKGTEKIETLRKEIKQLRKDQEGLHGSKMSVPRAIIASTIKHKEDQIHEIEHEQAKAQRTQDLEKIKKIESEAPKRMSELTKLEEKRTVINDSIKYSKDLIKFGKIIDLQTILTPDQWQEKIGELRKEIEQGRKYKDEELRGSDMSTARAIISSEIREKEKMIEKMENAEKKIAQHQVKIDELWSNISDLHQYIEKELHGRDMGGARAIIFSDIAQMEAEIHKLENEQTMARRSVEKSWSKMIKKTTIGTQEKDMSWQHLKEIHTQLYAGINADNLKTMRKFFVEQNARTNGTVDLSNLKEGFDSDIFWEVVISGVTSPVKAFGQDVQEGYTLSS